MRKYSHWKSAARIAVALLLCARAGQGLAVTDEQRIEAATAVASTNALCTKLPKFYWEIGDRNGKMAGDSVGSQPPIATTPMAIYSAGKWIYGAYAFEKRDGQLSDADIQSLTMQSGYTESASCLLQTKVGACQTAMNQLDSNAVDKFYYAGGHFQKHAVDLGLSSYNKSQLASEITSQLGGGFTLTYNQPQLAGGAKSSASDYAIFLRKILNGTVLLSGSSLGTDAVCTYNGPTDPVTGRVNCPTALYSPANDSELGLSEAWHYSIGHWVEDDPVVGDGAYSSPGAGGFYPWIDASKTYYGVLARVAGWQEEAPSADSVKCGRLIREAWLTPPQ